MTDFRTFWRWKELAEESLHKTFKEALLDADYYAGEQWTEEERQILLERGQPVLTLNFIKPTIDVVIGLETRVRTDIRVMPRGLHDQAVADILTAAIKYEFDANEAEYVFRSAFEDMVKSGMGWVCVERAYFNPNTIVSLQYVPFDEVIYDPDSIAYDLSDARYVIRRKWVDIQEALVRFPNIRDRFVQRSDGVWVYVGPQDTGYDMAEAPEQPIRHKGYPDIFGNVKQWEDEPWIKPREGMVLVWEVCYRQWEPVEVWWNVNTNEAIRKDAGYEPTGPDWVTQTQTLPTLRTALIVGRDIIQDRAEDVQIGYYKYVPFRAYGGRKVRFFGLIRQMRDAQADLNKRAIKALHIMNTNQVLVEEGAIDPDQEAYIREEIARPDGFIVLKRDALAQGRIKVLRDTALAQQQMVIANQRRIEIQETTGVNMEMVGAESKAISGRAILARQAQGNIIMSPLFDNYRRSKRMAAWIAAELIRQYYPPGRYIRLLDEYGKMEPVAIPEGLKNMRYDIIVGETPYAESQKEIFATELANLIRQVPPDIAPTLFKVWLKLVDVPYKDEVMEELDRLSQLQQAQVIMAQDQQALAMDEMAKDKALDRLSKFMRILRGQAPMGRPMEPGMPETQPSDTGFDIGG